MEHRIAGIKEYKGQGPNGKLAMTFLYFPSGYLTIEIDDIYGQYHKYMEVKLDNKCILAIVMNKIYQEIL